MYRNMTTASAMNRVRKASNRTLLLIIALVAVLILQGCKVPFKNKLIMIFEDGTRYFQKRESKNAAECRDWWTFAQSAVDKYKVKYDRFSTDDKKQVDDSATKLAQEVQKCYAAHNAKVEPDIVNWFRGFNVDIFGPPAVPVVPAADQTQAINQGTIVQSKSQNNKQGIVTGEYMDDQCKTAATTNTKDNQAPYYKVKFDDKSENCLPRNDLTIMQRVPPPVAAPIDPTKQTAGSPQTTSTALQPPPIVNPPPHPQLTSGSLESSASTATSGIAPGATTMAGVHKHDTSVLEELDLKNEFQSDVDDLEKGSSSHSRAKGTDNAWVVEAKGALQSGYHSHHLAAQELF